MAQRPRQTTSRWRPVLLPAAALLAMTLIAYAPAFRAGFIWDDPDYVTNNATLRSLDGLRQIWFVPQATPQYYPLVHTSFWIEYQLSGLNPTGYHAVNVLLHAVAAILLWRVLTMLEVPGAWLAAGMFAVHPIHVESVAWVTERKNVLSGVFYLASALMYLRFVGAALVSPDSPLNDEQRATHVSRLPWRLYVISLALF